MDYYYYKKFELCDITVVEKTGKITGILLKKETLTCEFKQSPLIKETFLELDEYFKKKRKTFDIPYELIGTPFQITVWRELVKIPYGVVKTYKDIACAISKDKAYRAVGGANNKNPISIVVPCHRVIGSNGVLVGYSGGLDIKRKLLELEMN